MKRLALTLEFDVPDASASTFLQLLVARMHKYLAKHAVTVYRVDSKID
ncbi:hypothetical protein VPHD530_0007 [Vibrio phage D530]